MTTLVPHEVAKAILQMEIFQQNWHKLYVPKQFITHRIIDNNQTKATNNQNRNYIPTALYNTM